MSQVDVTSRAARPILISVKTRTFRFPGIITAQMVLTCKLNLGLLYSYKPVSVFTNVAPGLFAYYNEQVLTEVHSSRYYKPVYSEKSLYVRCLICIFCLK